MSWTEILGMGLGFIGCLIAVAIGLRPVHRRRRARRLLAEGMALVGRGESQLALSRLREAEAAWAFNDDQGGRKAMLRDIELLRAILTEILRLLPDSEAGQLAPRVEATLHGLAALFGDRANFRIDSRTMKGDAPTRWVQLDDELRALRRDIRAACDSS